MAAVASQPPTGPNSSRSSSVMNGHPAVDYINGHGALPGSPASTSTPTSAPVAPVSKKTKVKKPVDDNEKAKLVAARLNQLEIGFAEEKDQELEIGGSPSLGCKYCTLSRIFRQHRKARYGCYDTCVHRKYAIRIDPSYSR